MKTQILIWRNHVNKSVKTPVFTFNRILCPPHLCVTDVNYTC